MVQQKRHCPIFSPYLLRLKEKGEPERAIHSNIKKCSEARCSLQKEEMFIHTNIFIRRIGLLKYGVISKDKVVPMLN
jgi:hypothetical protein